MNKCNHKKFLLVFPSVHITSWLLSATENTVCSLKREKEERQRGLLIIQTFFRSLPGLNLFQPHFCHHRSEQQSFLKAQRGQVPNIRDLTYRQRRGPRSSSAPHSPGRSQQAWEELSSCRGKSRKLSWTDGHGDHLNPFTGASSHHPVFTL